MTGCVQAVGKIDSHLYARGVASAAFRGYPDGVVDARGIGAEGCHVFEELLLCQLVGERVNVLKPGEDRADVGELDDMAGVELLAEQGWVFESFLGRGSDRNAHEGIVAA